MSLKPQEIEQVPEETVRIVNGIIKVGDYGRIETCIYGREK
jgi:hypothetical protein